MNEVWVLVSDMFMELLSVEIITRHKKEKLHFYNEKSERISIDEVKGRLAERIKETRVPYYGTEYSSVYRCEKGRFISEIIRLKNLWRLQKMFTYIILLAAAWKNWHTY